MIILYIILILIALLIGILMLNTFRNKREKEVEEKTEKIELDVDKIAKSLGEAVRYKTIASDKIEEFDEKEFLGFHEHLEKTYPKLHKTLYKEVVNKYSLLYKWEAKNVKKAPIVLMAHIDVVPVDKRTISDWEYDPYAGKVAEGFVWGRGTLDMKGQLIALCEAVEYMIDKGFTPTRDIYLAFGQDEETLGGLGSKQIVAILKDRGVRPEFVLDEGGVIIDGGLVGVDGDIGLIGVCEKGYADITIEATSKGGHAAQPPKDTAVSQLAEAILLLRKKHMKPKMNKVLKSFLTTLSPHMNFPLRMVTSNLWLFKRVVLMSLGKSAMSGALTKTTYAPTMLTGSTAPNVLAQKATAVINFRIAPDSSIKELTEHVENVLKKIEVKISEVKAYEPSKVSNTDSESYRMLKKSLKQTMPDIAISPYIMVGATDSRLYSEISENVFLIFPFRMSTEQLRSLHGTNEKVSLSSLSEGVEFLIRLLDNSNK
jgi:carboxypeptidase PM20D1